MLVLEDSDDEILYLAKGLPREWVGSGKAIQIEKSPTRWGKASFSLKTSPESRSVIGNVELDGTKLPREVHFKLRLPKQMILERVTVNGKPSALAGVHGDTVIISTAGARRFEIAGQIRA
jgi:hypothetical protein